MLVWKAILSLLRFAEKEAIAGLVLGGNFGFLSWLSSYSHWLTWSSWTCVLILLFSSAPLLLFANSNKKLKVWGLNSVVDRQWTVCWSSGGFFSWLQGARLPEFRYFRDLDGTISMPSTPWKSMNMHHPCIKYFTVMLGIWCLMSWTGWTFRTFYFSHFSGSVFLVIVLLAEAKNPTDKKSKPMFYLHNSFLFTWQWMLVSKFQSKKLVQGPSATPELH